eukprot:gnl/TRDRNA2_/TRDRNA2_191608_c0_seq1.p1 gnl/TRDRNA2_/TRDRNA2_191608_c0~~gnl/TRDRNA2_/TRDRNA2_191608_c0_seq1.p1  ORF type:complete len:233 (+),score=73.25 gnl/TRDRNA2_/TRDRNA2_191608_c0_seq1:31-729(+)
MVSTEASGGVSVEAEDGAAKSLPLRGSELLRNFQRRQKLGLVPGQAPLAAVLPPERCAALCAHEAFGYSSAAEGDEAGGAGETDAAVSGADAASNAELEGRCSALRGQIAEVENELAKARTDAVEVGAQIASVQKEMEAAVDEHGTLTRAVAEAIAREADLAGETLRLEAALRDCGVSPKAAHDEQALPPEAEDDSASPRERATLLEKLRLHRAHFLSLEAENADLRRRCLL